MKSMLNPRWVVVFLGCLLGPTAVAYGQFGVPRQLQGQSPLGAETERTQRWMVGIRVVAARGPCAGIYGTFPVPVDWPEQDVKVVDEKVSDTVRSTQIRNLPDGVRQMVIVAPQLNYGEQAEAVFTFEITRRTQPVPEDTTIFKVPRSTSREIRKCLASSPMIDVRSTKVRMKAKELTADRETAWGKVEAIHDWIKENVEHTNDPLRGALETLGTQKGNHEDLANLFIALCRAAKVPARTVWVPNYCYAEFYLEGEAGEGIWVPCELKEETVFGTVSRPYMILQKGDNIQVPEKKERQRFVPELLKVKKGSQPKVEFVRQNLGIK